MPGLEDDAHLAEMAETGELDFLRQHLAAESAPQTPAPAETVEQPEVTEEEETVEETETPEPEETEEPEVVSAEEEEDDGVEYIDLSPEAEALLNEKYGGDLDKALKSLSEGQGLIGRQGQELGDLRKELAQMRQELQQGLAQAKPYSEWPDEDDEPHVAGAKFAQIAEEAYARQDADTFQTTLSAWGEYDPMGARNFANLKSLEFQVAQMANQTSAPSEGPGELERGVAALKEKYPDLTDPSVMEAVTKEMEARPTLGRILQDATTSERVAALEDLYLLVASRKTSDTAQQARKRVALRTSEEARQARQQAQVAQTTRNREKVIEKSPERVVPIGQTGLNFDFDKLNEMLDPGDRV